jgi:hypothetical protein
LISLPLLETSETQLGVITSRYIFPNNKGGKIKKKKVKRPTYPIFFGLCYPNYTYFFIWPDVF